jgi:L-xylulose reductase
MTDLTGKTILVTGASSGIGKATAEYLVSCGATVIGGGRSVAALEELATRAGVTPLPFDLESEDSIRDAVSDLDLWGVVNCGGFGGEIATPMETDIDVFDKVIRVNARGSLLVIKHTAPGMIARGKGGSIVNVSSQASLVALRGHVSYGSSKAALDNITRVSALELGQYAIRVNGVNPTVVLNDMSAFYWGRSEIATPFLSQMPLGRWATTADVAGPIGFLLSDESAMITGVSLPIDGGFTCV